MNYNRFGKLTATKDYLVSSIEADYCPTNRSHCHKGYFWCTHLKAWNFASHVISTNLPAYTICIQCAYPNSLEFIND